MNALVYDKTDKGREEIATRKYHVPPKLRTLLVMIDGRHPLDALLAKFAALGLTQDCVDALISDDYIAPVAGSIVTPPPAPAAAPVAARPPALAARERLAARARAAQRARPDEDEATVHEPLDHAEEAYGLLEAPAVAPLLAPQLTDAERFQALYAFYNQTIKSTIGLRGVMLQLKVEKAATLDDLALLRTPYLDAVLKAKGEEMMLSLQGRLDSLLADDGAAV